MSLSLLRNCDYHPLVGREKFGVFIPISNDFEEQSIKHKHSAYEIIINFEKDSNKPKHYWAEITSPNVVHDRNQCMHCYSIFIEKEYFESRFKMYEQDIPVFIGESFEFCSDISILDTCQKPHLTDGLKMR